MSHTPSPMSPDWSSGLCGCCSGPNANPGFFCASVCCGFIAQAVLLHDAGLERGWVYPAIAYSLMDLCSAGSLAVLAFMSLRSNMATALQRQEGICYTSCVSVCCYPCALSQVHRDIYDRRYCFPPNDSMINSILGEIENRMPTPYEPVPSRI
jgi:Cys-rich protein (TIGR01571 family)